MITPKTLNVFLRGRHIGVLRGRGLKLSFQYESSVVAEYGRRDTNTYLTAANTAQYGWGPGPSGTALQAAL